jgi:hypothetical protein
MRTAPSSGGTRVAAVMAAYNRKKLTLACLRSLRAHQVPGVTLDVFVLDDASSDGTSLDDGGLAVLLDTAGQLRERGEEAVIVAGSTRHLDTGELTYGGVVHPHRWRPLRSERVKPGDAPRRATPRTATPPSSPRPSSSALGTSIPHSCNRGGTLTTGFARGRPAVRSGSPQGRSGPVRPIRKRRTGERPLGEELRRLWSLKQLKPGPWAVYCRRWAGRLWPLYWLSPYVRGGLRLVLQRTTPARRGAV